MTTIFASTLAQEMRNRGIEIRTRTQIARIEKFAHGYSVFTTHGEEISADLVMYATGRKPNTRGLGLAEIGVEMNHEGAVIVDEWQRTTVPNIYAVGDVTDRLNLTPVAIAEGRAIAETLYNDNPIKMDHADVPTAVFSQPPIGTVGLTEDEARRKYGEIDIYSARFRPMKNTLSGRDERTLMKLVVDAAERPRGRLPHARPRRARDHPGPRDRGQMRRHQTAIRPDRRHPPERGRGIRHHARKNRPPDEIGGGVGETLLRSASTGSHSTYQRLRCLCWI